jgi:ABC-type dipeptide/oligopeptide/nickel transport system permease subunit
MKSRPPAQGEIAVFQYVIQRLLLVVLAFNLMGDALRDLLDPRLRGE